MSSDNPNSSLRLEQLLAGLPRDAAPSRDFWPDVQAALQASGNPRPLWNRWLGQLAAGVVLVAATATTTYFVARESLQTDAQIEARAAMEADAIATEYLRARAELDQLFAERVALLPAATRAKIESDLADLRRAAEDLAATLAQYPSDPLLHDLLMSTRQRELRLLADVSRMTDPNS